MKRYTAFLRGINISGRNKIGMPELKKKLTEAGFCDVSSYLNSGNLTFRAENGSIKETVEEIIRTGFQLEIPVYVIETDRLQEILSHAPSWWNSGEADQYNNLIFILSDDSPQEICEMIGSPSEGLEQIRIYDQVIFWTFDRKKYQKCNWWKKTASAGIAEKLTIRTAGTVFKACR